MSKNFSIDEKQKKQFASAYLLDYLINNNKKIHIFLEDNDKDLEPLLEFMMMNEYVAYLFFNFPELLLVVLSLIILIGRYTGYRVTELFRFKPLGR